MTGQKAIVFRRSNNSSIMKRPLLVLWLAGSATAVCFAGTIVGTVRAVPPAGGSESAGGGAYDNRRYKFAERLDYEHMRDFVVYIDQAVPGAPLAAPRLAAVTTQRDASFDPHVLPLPSARPCAGRTSTTSTTTCIRIRM